MWKNRLRRYEILSSEEVEVIHSQAMTILPLVRVHVLLGRSDFACSRARSANSKRIL